LVRKPPISRRSPSADLLCQLDDDPLGAADVAEPVALLVALQLADELSAAGSQAGDDGVDVEALVLRPEFVDLFTANERSIAAHRLARAGYQPPRDS
jgi:hypothetical protein